MTRLLLLAAQLVGCTADTEPGVDGGQVQLLDDGDYAVTWGEGQPGLWIDCDGFSIHEDTLSWLGSDCREPALPGVGVAGGCVQYHGNGYSWWLCPGPGYLTGGREEEGGEVVATFEAEWLR